ARRDGVGEVEGSWRLAREPSEWVWRGGPAASAGAPRSSIFDRGIASAAYTPRFRGSSEYGCSKRAVEEPSAPSAYPLTPPTRSHSSCRIRERASRAVGQFESDGR